MGTTSKYHSRDYWSQMPLVKHPKKMLRYAEHYATGIYSKAEAARRAGYANSSNAVMWLKETREESICPILWDYYDSLRRKNRLKFETTVEAITQELAMIAFSDVTKFVDLPAQEYDRKAHAAQTTWNALQKIAGYEIELKDYHEDVQEEAKKPSGAKKRKLTPPTPPTDKQRELALAFAEMSEAEQIEFMFWRTYQAGSIRIKNREEIPNELLPQIAEISSSKDGIKVKLHDKMSALEKLAKIRKMYDDEKENKGNTAGESIKELHVHVKGSRSTLQVNGERFNVEVSDADMKVTP
jgi:hypothetical protein